MSTQTFKIEGMTCESCVQKITHHLKILPEVSAVKVSLNEKKADITSERAISLKEVQSAISDLKKYKADYYDDETLAESSIAPAEKSFYETYKPLFTIFGYILTFSIAYQLSLEKFSFHYFMNHLMAGFFIGLSFFKFLNLKAFAEAFSNYDPLAKHLKAYGVIYPFIELGLSFLYIADKFLNVANVITILVLSITTFGVYRKLQSKNQFQCACLGATGFNLPLSNITIIENVTMIFMAGYSIFLGYK